MGRETGFESRVAHSAGVSGVARSFQPVYQDQLAAWRAAGLLGMDQNLDVRFGLKEHIFDGPALVTFWARPEVTGEGCEVGIPEKRMERAQDIILERLDHVEITGTRRL